MKNEERLAKDLCYIFFKKLKEYKSNKNVKRIVFCIEAEDLKIEIPLLKEAFKKCILNTPYSSAKVEFLYKYSINFSKVNNEKSIYLERIEFED